jgi:predicted PurR-regulated permease PerM
MEIDMIKSKPVLKREPETEHGAGNAALVEKVAVVLLFGLVVTSVFYILRPFVVGLMFGTILAVAAWPIRAWLVGRGLSGLVAAMLMLVALLLFVLVPAGLASPILVEEVRGLGERGVAWLSSSPELPGWITTLPFVGQPIADQWHRLLSGTPEAQKLLLSYVQPLRQFFTDAAVGLASSMLQIALSLVIATTSWARGAQVVSIFRDGLERLGGEELASITEVAGNAIKGVFYGIVGTAAVQGALMAIGFLICGVPGALPIGFVTLLLALSQFGSVLINIVWGGAAWWIYSVQGSSFLFWFMIAFGIFVTFLDNFLKPWLIGSNMNMPIMLVILGVFGGFISFGFLGLFIGPTLLAVAFALLAVWRSHPTSQ